MVNSSLRSILRVLLCHDFIDLALPILEVILERENREMSCHCNVALNGIALCINSSQLVFLNFFIPGFNPRSATGNAKPSPPAQVWRR